MFAFTLALFVHQASGNAAAECLKEHQKTAMDKVGAGEDVCKVFQEQLDCFENVQQCKGMLPVVKQASSQAGGSKCAFKCGKTDDKTSESPSRLRTGDKSSDLRTCTKDVQAKQTSAIQDATGDTEKTKKLFEEDICNLYQEQLNCYGDDREACAAALPDLKKATDRATSAMKSLYDVKECQFTCDGGLEETNAAGAVNPLLAVSLLISFWATLL